MCVVTHVCSGWPAVPQLGHMERTAAASRRRPQDEFWGEEAGRRFVEQQDQLVSLKEENTALKELMESGAAGAAGRMSPL
jgi:hypothetical protein